MTRQPVKEAPGRIGEDIDHVETTGEPVAFERDGRLVAVLVSTGTFAQFERLREEAEDRSDLDAARISLAEPGENLPHEKIKSELGI